MRKNSKRVNFSIRLTPDERQQMTDVYSQSGSQRSFTSYFRSIMLGHIQHPDAIDYERNNLNVEDSGVLSGSYDHRIYYQSRVIAAMYLMTMHDPSFANILKPNQKDLDKITRQIRGYKFDHHTATKEPLGHHR